MQSSILQAWEGSESLADIKSKADHLLKNWSVIQGEAGATFVKEKLNELADRRTSIETAISDSDGQLRQVSSQSVNPAEVASASARIGEVYSQLQPHE